MEIYFLTWYLQMFGSIAGSESFVISINEEGEVDCLMAEAPHGTAPSLEGLNRANPMAMILAAAGMLSHLKEQEAKKASRAIYEATSRNRLRRHQNGRYWWQRQY